MSRFVACLVGILSLGFASSAVAQPPPGGLILDVTDGQSAALVGVEVSLLGTDFTRHARTDLDGRARFIGLTPGTYEVKLDPPGFHSVVLQGIRVDSGAAPSLRVLLRESTSAVDEQDASRARTPLLDRRAIGSSTIVSHEEIEEVPTSREPWSIISTIPGMTTDRFNIAGSEAGDQAKFVGKGVDWTQSTWSMDDVEFTNLANLGFSSSMLDFNSLEQIRFATSGADFASQTPGLQIGLVTKQGTNRWSSGARLAYADSGLQSDNTEGLAQPPWVFSAPPIGSNRIEEAFEKHFGIGGPLVRDHAWIRFHFTQNDVEVLRISGQPDRSKLRNAGAKIHGQFGGRGTYKALYTVGDRVKMGLGGGIDRPPETTWDQSGPAPTMGAGVGYFFRPGLGIALQASRSEGGFLFQPRGDFDQQIFQDANGVFHRTFSKYETDRPSDQLLAKGDWIFGTGSWDHELKFGFRYKSAAVDSFSKYSAFDLVASKYYLPGEVALSRELSTSVGLESFNVWVGDTALLGPWTIAAGAHFSTQSGQQEASTARPNGLAPSLVEGLDFPGFDPGFEWTDLSPRVGLSYTFAGKRRLLLRANYARYVDQLGSSVVSFSLPLSYVGVTYAWNDADGDDLVDWDDAANTGELVDQNADDIIDCNDSLFWINIDPCNTGSASSNAKIDPDLEAPVTDEWIVGAELEVLTDFTVAVAYTRRDRERFVWTPFYDYPTFVNEGRLEPLAGLEIYDCGGSASGSAPDGRTYDEPYCALNSNDPRLPPDRARFETNMPGYEQRYNGVEIAATKRLSNRWMLRSFVSYGVWANRFTGLPLTPGLHGGGSHFAGDPTNFQGGTAADGDLVTVQSLSSLESSAKDKVFLGSSRWQLNVDGLYQLPLGFSVSGNLYGREGYGLADFVRVPVAAEGIKSVQVEDVDANRYDDVWLLDLRVAKRFPVDSRASVEIAAEVFNATNENTVLQVGQQLNSSAYRRIEEIVSPRIVRLVAAVSF